MISLQELARLLGADLLAPGDARRPADPSAAGAVLVGDVEHDSRRVGAGALFACIPGAANDGHDYADAAVAAGAAALLVERAIPAAAPRLVVDSVRRAVGHAAAAVHGYPARRLDLAGVTGTKGKTTTVRLLGGLLAADGRAPAETSTLTGSLTTSEATDLQRILSEARRRGAGAAVIEVSSHALVMHRLNGCRFRVAAFTNLGRDHLDYHGTMEDYFDAKALLFTKDRADFAVVDVTSEQGRRLADRARAEIPVAEVDPVAVELLGADAGSSVFRWRGQTVALPLGGAFNRANAVLAAETALVLGMAPGAVAEGLARAVPVPGRFESVHAGQDFAVIVDFAHTPESLAAVLQAARSHTRRCLTVVFGAGGERDHGRRPLMGEVAERLADRVIVTSDNPRSEDPDQIIAEVVEGMSNAPERCDADRRRAVRHALSTARSGDTVVVAGRGNETTQTIGGRRLAFDDRDVVRSELERLSAPGRARGSSR